MIKYILAGGYVQKAKDGGKAFCEELIKGIDKKTIKILDCTFARKNEDWVKDIEKDNTFFSNFIKDFELELADPNIFIEQVKNSDVIYLKGGYAALLMETLGKNESWTKELEGKVLAGTSAGADVIAKYYTVLKNHRIGDGLGLLPIKFIPHWKSDFSNDDNGDINWNEELEKLKEYKENLPVYTLAEGEFKIFVE